jgi:photosystem II stability/assembly factor-like uncharacterized protein
MKKLLLSVFVLSAASGAYAQWTQQNTSFSTENRTVIEIDIVDENIVWGVGYDGAPITAEHPEADNVQEFTKTINGGTTWEMGIIDLGGDPLLAVNNMHAIDANTSWVSSIVGSAGKGKLFKTIDGGESWTLSNPGVGNNFLHAESFQNGVHFFNATTGVVFGDPIGAGPGLWEVYRTVNGGTSWTQTTGWTGALAAGEGEYGYNGGNISAGNTFWFVTSLGNLYRTTDLGVTWTKIDTPIADFGGVETASSTGRAYFSDNNNGIIIATANATATTPTYTLYRTTNGGTTWTTVGPYTSGYRSMDFIPGSSRLVSVGNNGSAYSSAYSDDYGISWTEIEANNDQKVTVAFLNGTTGWASSFDDGVGTGGIFKYSGPALGLQGVAARAQFSVSPNPTSGMLQVANDNAAINEVAVYDITGKQVYTGKFSSLNQVDLDLTALNTGAYFLKATSDTGATQTIKIMKN